MHRFRKRTRFEKRDKCVECGTRAATEGQMWCAECGLCLEDRRIVSVCPFCGDDWSPHHNPSFDTGASVLIVLGPGYLSDMILEDKDGDYWHLDPGEDGDIVYYVLTPISPKKAIEFITMRIQGLGKQIASYRGARQKVERRL